MADLPLILITNDDGIDAQGLQALRKALVSISRPVVVAPQIEQSACSHSITLQRPLRYKQQGEDSYSLDGTPADCVYMALFSDRFLPRKPDLVVSGINHGVNLGTDIFYSGTVGGAREAAIRGIASIAFSYDGNDVPPNVVEMAQQMTQRLIRAINPSGIVTLLNVNFPADPTQGVQVTHLGRRLYEDSVMTRIDPYGGEYLWVGGRAIDLDNEEGSDTEAFRQGYVTVTPLALEATNTDHMTTATFVATGHQPK